MKREPDLTSTSDHRDAGEEIPARLRRAPIVSIAYFLISGTVSLMIGAAVSLLASGTERLVLWSVTTSVVAVSAGYAYESLPFGVRE